MALFFYNVALFVFSPVILLVIWVRLVRGKESREHIAERFGVLDRAIAADTRTERYWVHAVSVGEVMAAVPVLRELRKRHPDALIFLTTTTIGGLEVATKNRDADYVSAFPLDFLPCVVAAVRAVRPTALLLMEWEVWLNLLAVAKQSGATVAVINGRISDTGLKRGGTARFWLSPALKMVDVFAMQSVEDARRAGIVGADVSRVVAVGNTKFDESATMLTDGERADLRREFGIPDGVPVLICGSTRDAPDKTGRDEEEIIADALTILAGTVPTLYVIVAPRHIERATRVVEALKTSQSGQSRPQHIQQRSLMLPVLASLQEKTSSLSHTASSLPHDKTSFPLIEASLMLAAKSSHPVTTSPHLYLASGLPQTTLPESVLPISQSVAPLPILILDTFGELARAYAVADVAFVGGSLVRRGGQSVFQPLAQGVPAVFGTYMNNQRDIAALAQSEGVGFMVNDAATLAETVRRLLTLSPDEKTALKAKCRAVIEANQGVTARALDLVDAGKGAR